MLRFISLILFFTSQLAFANICQKWSSPVKTGDMDYSVINEASGLAHSSQFKDRLYHVNDSGDGPNFYQTQVNGNDLKKVSINEFEAWDVEALAYGDCLQAEKCLYIGDIGDNDEFRTRISIVIVKELKNFPSTVSAERIVDVKYPDGAHNAEGMALHPDGSLYILTKKADYVNRRSQVASLYRLSPEQMYSKAKGDRILQKVGDIDVPYLNYRYNLFGRIVTGLDFSPDGSKLLILTYSNFLEVNLDLTTVLEGNEIDSRAWEENKDYKINNTISLPQQEAVTYLDSKTILYSTEYHEGYNVGLYKSVCEAY